MQLDLFLPGKDNIDSLDILTVMENVTSRLCFVFDEFDSVQSKSVQTKFADTIKALSDNAPHVTIGIVGISSSVDNLIGQHSSLERCLRQIEMPRMSKDELRQIVMKGLDLLQLEMEDQVREKIVDFSSGFPHFTHLLSKYACRECIVNTEGANIVSDVHYRKAIDAAIDNTNQSIRDTYQKATIASKTKSKFEDVIAACALAKSDEFNTFSTNDILEPYYYVTDQKIRGNSIAYNLQKLCEPERGSILTKVGETINIRYRFSNPLMKVYIKMKLDQQGQYHQPSLFKRKR